MYAFFIEHLYSVDLIQAAHFENNVKPDNQLQHSPGFVWSTINAKSTNL